ncbi:MAG: HlyD family efflux transporter periplasmic adaptor subunit [Planctomycetaceae bacterium]|nr:HlyD family efflux transporter periplasmic adaptor subunit [Planctomycetaceae bacterium]
MSDTQLDLRNLAINRSHSSTNGKPRRRRRLLRYVLPLGILAGFVGLIVAASGRQFLPGTSVTVVPVIVQRSEIQKAGRALFQAAGWIEPRPTSVSVPALAPGVIEELLVVEGQEVKRGETIARLISVDAEIAVEQARASLALSEGELQRAQVELKAAESRLNNPLHLKAPLSEARSLLAKTITDSQKLPFVIRAAEATVDFTRRSFEGKRNAGESIPQVVVLQSERDYLTARAELEELQTRAPNLKREIEALQEKVQALEEQLGLLIEEHRQVGEARAKVNSATAACDDAGLRLRQAELTLQRMQICAPMDGRVLRLLASPGTRMMGLEQTAGQNSSTVVEMYDPARLQVRADVRLEDVPLVTPGAPVEIKTASSFHPINGTVLQSTSTANIQKNTLEVKVELIDPPSTVRPEMLVTATFLAPRSNTPPELPLETDRIFVPRQLVSSNDSGSMVWVVDENNQANLRTVTLGGDGRNGLVEVTAGLNETDKLIASATSELNPGETVVIREEDPMIGVEK